MSATTGGEAEVQGLGEPGRAATGDEKRLPPEVVRCLDDYRSRARSFAIVKGAALTVTVYIVIVVVAALLDRFVRMPAWMRVTLSFGSISAVAALAYYSLIRPFIVRSGARDTALDLERTDPEFNEGLVTTVDHLATEGMPTAFSRALLSEVARGSANIAGELDVSQVMPARLVKRILVVSLVAVAIFAALFAVPGLGFARLVARFHAPLANLPRASLIELKVEPGSKVVGIGDSVEVRASLSAPFEGRVVLHIEPEGESWTESEMASRAGSAVPTPEGKRPLGFARKIDVVTSTFDYYVTAGDAESAAYRIVAVDRPLPELFRVTYKPPAYTGSPPNTEEGPTGAVRGLKGSHVTLSIKPSVAVTEAKLVKDGFSIPMAISEEGMLASCEFELEKDGSYSLHLEGAHGLANREGREYPIKALDDAPPTVNANLIRAGSRVDPEGALRIRYDARDDWGVEGLRSFVSLNGGDAEAKDLVVAQPGRRAANDFLVDLAVLSAERGDHVSVLVSARDSLGQVGRSRAIMVWLGRDVSAREAAERAKRIAAAAEAVREMEKLQQVLRNDRAEFAKLMREEAWSPESERKLAEVRRLERDLQAKAELAREELKAAGQLADDDLARALSAAARKLLRDRMESERLDEMMASVDSTDKKSLARTADALERASEQAPGEDGLADKLDVVADGEQATAALERDASLTERREKLDEIRKEPQTPARDEFVQREEDLMARQQQELGEDAKELGLDVKNPQWTPQAQALAEKGKRAAEEIAGQDRLADDMAALAEEAKQIAKGDPEDAEAKLDAIRAGMDGIEAELAEAAMDENALDRPDYTAARDEDLARAALEGVERRNLDEANPQEDSREAAKRMGEELSEAAKALDTLEQGEQQRRDQGEAKPDAKALAATKRESEKARDTLARLAGDPAEALERLAAREEGVAKEAARADKQANKQADKQAEAREELAELAETQDHLAKEAERLAERLMHEANAETAQAKPDAEHVAALDKLREGVEKVAKEEMHAAAKALKKAAHGKPHAAKEAGHHGKKAAEKLASLAGKAKKMAEAHAAAKAAKPGEQHKQGAPHDALAQLDKMADLEAAQRKLAAKTAATDQNNQAARKQLAQEQEGLKAQSQKAMEAMRAQQKQLQALQKEAHDAAQQAKALAKAAHEVANELKKAGHAAKAEPKAGHVSKGADKLAKAVAKAAQAAHKAMPHAAGPMKAAAKHASKAAHSAKAGHKSAKAGHKSAKAGHKSAKAGHKSGQPHQGKPGAGKFSEAAKDLEQAAENLEQAAAAAQQAMAPQAKSSMQAAAKEQSAAAKALKAGQKPGSHGQAQQSQQKAADALAQARQQLANAINSARTQQASAKQSGQPKPGQSKSKGTKPGSMPGGSPPQADGRVTGEAPRDDSDWGRLRKTDDLAKFAEREGIAVHYADPIRLYFEAVAKEGSDE